VWHNAVARAECQQIQIGRMTNLQDFVMVHVGFDHPTRIGDFCSITHHTTVHGCTIGNDCLIGINAVIMDGAEIGEGSIVAGGAMVTEGKVFPPHAIIAGVPAKQIGERDASRAHRRPRRRHHPPAPPTRGGQPRGGAGPANHACPAAKLALIEKDADR